MRTSGTFLLHEIMHAVKITQDRPHGRSQNKLVMCVDNWELTDDFRTYSQGSGFSPRQETYLRAPDVAKAARTEGLDITTVMP